jgi:hypothetical protein
MQPGVGVKCEEEKKKIIFSQIRKKLMAFAKKKDSR